jgi:hypothetical protein
MSEFSKGEPKVLATEYGTATIYPDGFLAHVNAPTRLQGQGKAGGEIMKKVLEYADDNGITLRTNPDRWLEHRMPKYGFEQTDEKTGYRDDLSSYVRHPRTRGED